MDRNLYIGDFFLAYLCMNAIFRHMPVNIYVSFVNFLALKAEID